MKFGHQSLVALKMGDLFNGQLNHLTAFLAIHQTLFYQVRAVAVPGALQQALDMKKKRKPIRHLQDKKLREAAEAPLQTAGYEPIRHHWAQHPRDLPPFGFDTIRQMLYDGEVKLALAIRCAPMFGVEWAYKENDEWVPGVRAKRPEVAEFILRQLNKIWTNHLHEIARSQEWGWSAGEVRLKLSEFNLVEIDRLEPRQAMDTRLLLRGAEPVGVRVDRVRGVGIVDLPFPNAFFHAHDKADGEWYGRSTCLGAYSPWVDKWMHGGATDVRRLFMHKDAYGGADMAYPSGTTMINGRAVPNVDIARQIVEQMTAGAVTTTPSERDGFGNKKWEITRATVAANPQHILQYPQDLDGEIRTGIGITDGVMDDDGSGGWAGKRIQMAAFYATLDTWIRQIVSDFTEQIFEKLVELNWGDDETFEITHKPLAEQAMEQQSNAGPGQMDPNMMPPGADGPGFGGPGDDSGFGGGFDEGGGGDNPFMMSLAESLGRRRSPVRMSNGKPHSKPTRLAVAHAPADGVTINGVDYVGGQFIPDTSQAEVDQAKAEQGDSDVETTPKPKAEFAKGNVIDLPAPAANPGKERLASLAKIVAQSKGRQQRAENRKKLSDEIRRLLPSDTRKRILAINQLGNVSKDFFVQSQINTVLTPLLEQANASLSKENLQRFDDGILKAVSKDKYSHPGNESSVRDVVETAKTIGLAVAGIDEIAQLAGYRDGTKVEFFVLGNGSEIAVSSDDGYESNRVIKRDKSNRVVIHNDSIRVKEPGSGLGTQLFARQVSSAIESGVSKIVAIAAREEGKYNGYYTWPRLGYDALLPETIRDSLPPDLSGAVSVSDLMKSKAGRDWWKENGVSLKMEFDLREGSLSRRVLASYLKKKVENERKG